MHQATENKLPRKLFSKKEIADHLGISVRTLANWMTKRRIPYYRCGGRILFDFDKVMKAMDSYEVRITKRGD